MREKINEIKHFRPFSLRLEHRPEDHWNGIVTGGHLQTFKDLPLT